MVEDVLRMVEHRLDEGVAVSESSAAEGEDEYVDDEEEAMKGPLEIASSPPLVKWLRSRLLA